jgi:hypothetical protein
MVKCNTHTNTHTPSPPTQLSCDNCHIIFSRADSLKRHVGKYCKAKKTDINGPSKDELFQIIIEQKDMIDKLVGKVGNTNNTNCHNTTNNITQNIQINGFGDEDISHLTDSIKAMICGNVYGSVAKCIEIVHMDDTRPQNKTLRIKSRKRNEIEKYDANKQKWKICDLIVGVKELIGLNYDRVIGFYDEYGVKKKMNTNKKKCFDQFIEDMDDEKPEVTKRLEDDAKTLIKNFD